MTFDIPPHPVILRNASDEESHSRNTLNAFLYNKVNQPAIEPTLLCGAKVNPITQPQTTFEAVLQRIPPQMLFVILKS